MSSNALPGFSDDIMVNTIVKHYPDGVSRIIAANKAIFRKPGFERPHSMDYTPHEAALVKAGKALPPRFQPIEDVSAAMEHAYAIDERRGIMADGGLTEREEQAKKDNLERAQRRARTAVRDLALSNPFKFFVTLTFDKTKVDRWDDKEVFRVTKNWLDNMVRRDALAYVLVPERHKDGAIHFHGFFNDAVKGTDSGHKTERGQTIYNLPRWPWGFTTAIDVYGDYGAAVSYVCKYITKGKEKVGGRWYYHGGALKRPEREYINTDLADRADPGKKFAIKNLENVEVTVIETEV